MPVQPIPEPEINASGLEERTGITLTFSHDNPSETQIISPAGETLYTVETETSYSLPLPITKHNTQTTIRRGSTTHTSSSPRETPGSGGELVATLVWRDILPDKVVGEDQPQINHCKFLSHSLSVFEVNEKKYVWAGKGPNENPHLHDGIDDRALARYYPSKRNIETFEMESAQLWCAHHALDILDVVVVTFLALEKNRRVKPYII